MSRLTLTLLQASVLLNSIATLILALAVRRLLKVLRDLLQEGDEYGSD